MRKLFVILILLLAWTLVGGLQHAISQPRSASSIFKGPFHLELKPAPGPARYYRSRTLYNSLGDVKGGVLSSFVVAGDFRRQFTGYRKDGCALEEFRWRNVRITTRSPADGKELGTRRIPFAEDFTYRICFEDSFAVVTDAIDYSSLPRTLDGLLFYEQIVDSHHPFDVALTRSHGSTQGLRFVGDEVQLPYFKEHELSFRPLGYWHFYGRDGYRLRLTGLTTRNGETGAVINYGEFSGPGLFDSNLKMAGDQMVSEKEATQTWGTIVVSLKDGVPLWATLLERVDRLDRSKDPKNPILGFFREVVVETIDRSEFDSGGTS